MSQNIKRQPNYHKTTPELRKAVCEDNVLHCLSVKQICQKYRLADKTVRNILNRFDERQTVLYKKRGGVKRRKIEDHHGEFLRNKVDNEDEGSILTLESIRRLLMDNFPEDFPQKESISLTTICRYLNEKLTLTLKRASPIERAQESQKTKEARLAYCEWIFKKGISYNDDCIFVDESGFNACMVPGRARSLKGKKAHVMTKVKRAKNISIIAAMSARKVEYLEVLMVDRGTDRFIFGSFIMELLKKLDEEYNRSFYVVMDNARFHHSLNIKEIFSRTQHKCVFLPAYSPMFNPIESMFSKLKNFVKRAPNAVKDDLVLCIKDAGNTVTADNCEGWVRHSADNMYKCVRGINVTFDN